MSWSVYYKFITHTTTNSLCLNVYFLVNVMRYIFLSYSFCCSCSLLSLSDTGLYFSGFHLDNRVCPGFTYHVRDLRTDREVLEGEPRVLQSIGMGYGKRLTFKGDKRNLNDCYFWTDNNPEGYGFAIRVVSKGDNFVIYDSLNQSIGDVVIESVEGPQVEESMKCCKGDVTKMVCVRFTCSIRYHNKLEQNLYDIANQDLQSLDGLVEITKSKKSKEAMVSCIRDVNISKVGMCTLWNDLI